MTWRPTRGFRVGKMRERVSIQSSVETIDDAGQPIRGWLDVLVNEPATWEPISGQEILRGRQVEAGITDIFQIHYKSTITPEMRLTFGLVTYGIVYVKHVDGGKRYMELQCKAVK